MDREQAKRNMATGLWLGLMATGLFALTFIVATIYIASA
jgi:tetrahydromethanopterin S-methyltransferase subunit B